MMNIMAISNRDASLKSINKINALILLSNNIFKKISKESRVPCNRWIKSLILASLKFLLDDNDYLIIVIWSCFDNVGNDNARTQRRIIRYIISIYNAFLNNYRRLFV